MLRLVKNRSIYFIAAPPQLLFRFDIFDVDQIVDYGKDSQPGRGVNAQFAADVAPVGSRRVD